MKLPVGSLRVLLGLYFILIFFAQHLPPQNTTSVIADQVASQGDYEVGNASINAVGNTVDL